jgi:hypothetical protein
MLVLRELGPMNILNLTVAILARGRRPEVKPRPLMESLRRALCQNQGRFRKDGVGRWGVA